jgi:hypothetical protein
LIGPLDTKPALLGQIQIANVVFHRLVSSCASLWRV